jgi:hypothetical protein
VSKTLWPTARFEETADPALSYTHSTALT